MSNYYEMRLFVAGNDTTSVQAEANLTKICETHLESDEYDIEVIDILLDMQAAVQNRVFITPTLLAHINSSDPITLIGSLGDSQMVLSALGIM
ncbi:circadian clock KaiB family protein [Anaerolineales bacterium HSG6]|nr:circadian clock KaiB family protein [Anaerolineales bacterium HSG6]